MKHHSRIYPMPDGTVLSASRARGTWGEGPFLHRSRKGRYWVEHVGHYAEWVSHQEAVRWCLGRGIEPPRDLERYVEQVSE